MAKFDIINIAFNECPKNYLDFIDIKKNKPLKIEATGKVSEGWYFKGTDPFEINGQWWIDVVQIGDYIPNFPGDENFKDFPVDDDEKIESIQESVLIEDIIRLNP